VAAAYSHGVAEERRTIRGPAVMRAMAHPARLAILEHLAEGNEATATECAAVIGLSPSATSYHLRELAKAGLVQEAPSRGDGRERVWRRPRAAVRVDTRDDADPGAHEAAMEFLGLVLDQDDALAREWFARAPTEPAEWSDAARIIRSRLLVTAAELAELTEQVTALIDPYLVRERPVAPEGARSVSILIRTVPLPARTSEE
jgi:DNA-binding transcriptional ArsR family regulator